MTGPERLTLLAKRSGRTVDDVIEIWHERAAIREYEGGKRRIGDVPDQRDPLRLSYQRLLILRALLDAGPLAGADVTRATAIPSGTAATTLQRLARAGWLTDEWERLDPTAIGRPLRHVYRLTALGRREARRLLARLCCATGGGRSRHR